MNDTEQELIEAAEKLVAAIDRANRIVDEFTRQFGPGFARETERLRTALRDHDRRKVMEACR